MPDPLLPPPPGLTFYSPVKHGGVRNYVAITWTRRDLEACADLNLPCADASGLLLEPVGKGKKPTAHDFVVMSWIKPTVVLRALRQGHAVMVADADIAYAVKPLWASYLAYNEQAQADGAWLEEKPTSNAGHFVLLCTPASLSFAKAWVASAERAIEEGLTDQKVLPQLEEGSYLRCNTLCRCLHTDYNLTEQGQRQQVAVLRTYLPSHFVYSPNWCTIGSPDWVPAIDPCDWSVLYLHIICVSAAADKAAVLRAAGFWFMDDGEGGQATFAGCQPQRGAASGVPACRPLHWRLPEAEAAHYSCASLGALGLVHGGEPAALAAVRSGAAARSKQAAEQLFDLIQNKKC